MPIEHSISDIYTSRILWSWGTVDDLHVNVRFLRWAHFSKGANRILAPPEHNDFRNRKLPTKATCLD